MSIDTSDGSKNMDYKAHVGTFQGFLVGAQVMIALVVLILIAMAVFLL